MTSEGNDDGLLTRSKNWERQPKLFLAALVYSLPAIVVYGAAVFSDGASVLRGLGLWPYPAIVVALALFTVTGCMVRAADFISTNDADAEVVLEVDTAAEPEQLETEYQELNAEIRWRDRQVTRLSYLLFASLGILAAVYIRGTEPEKPLVTVFGTYLTFLFLVSTTSKIGALRTLRARRRRLEEQFFHGIHAIGRASSVMTDTKDRVADPRPIASRFSASSTSIYLHWIVLGLWVGLYLLALVFATEPLL